MEPGYPGPSQDPNQPPPSYPPGSYPPPPDQPAAPQEYSVEPPYPGQPYPVQPYPGQPYPGQPYPGQPYSGQPYSGPPYAAPPPTAYQYQYPNTGYAVPPMLIGAPAGPNNTLGLLSMIFGIASIPLVVCCSFLSIALAVAAIVTGILAMRKVNLGQSTNRGMALTGLICGGVGVLFSVAWFVLATGSNILGTLTN